MSHSFVLLLFFGLWADMFKETRWKVPEILHFLQRKSHFTYRSCDDYDIGIPLIENYILVRVAFGVVLMLWVFFFFLAGLVSTGVVNKWQISSVSVFDLGALEPMWTGRIYVDGYRLSFVEGFSLFGRVRRNGWDERDLQSTVVRRSDGWRHQ